jgi:hypothetical protein
MTPGESSIELDTEQMQRLHALFFFFFFTAWGLTLPTLQYTLYFDLMS